MNRYIALVLLSLVVLFGCTSQNPTPPIPQNSTAQDLAYNLYVYPPMAATFDSNRTILIYEIYLANLTPINIDKVEVFADSPSGNPLKTVQGSELKADYGSSYSPLLPQKIFMWLEFPQGAEIPSKLYHKIHVTGTSMAGGNPIISTKTLDPGPTDVRALTTEGKPIAVIGPPVKGSGWLTASAPSNSVGHRRAVFTFNGVPYIAQRYAIDFLQVGPSGTVYKTDGKTNEDFYCYGADLIAVADGTVVDVKDGIPDNIPGSVPQATIAWLGGNYVVLDIGGHYAFYAHIKPWTVKVKIGDKVKKGDVIGQLGSSGNSFAPHLHFHIVSTKDAIFSDGEPYAYESYALQGSNRGLDEFSPIWYAPSPVLNRTMPVDGDIISFPE